MKRLYVGYPTALELWNAAELVGGMRSIAYASTMLQGSCSTHAALRQSCLSRGPWDTKLVHPLSLLVADVCDHCETKEAVSRIWSGDVAPGSFRLIDDLTAVSTPPFCFLQAAMQLEFVDLLQLGLEMCGTYSSGPSGTEEHQLQRPLTSVASISAYLEGAGSAYGILKARRALNYLIDRVASPMEGIVYLLLCLPYRYGGYGLTTPEANLRLDIPHELGRFSSGKRFLVADLCWPQEKVCVEYDSDEHHSGGAKAARDSARRDILAAMGYRVHTLNMAQVANASQFDAVARMIAGELGHRLHDNPGRDNYAAMMTARSKLRATLLNRQRCWKRKGQRKRK